MTTRARPLAVVLGVVACCSTLPARAQSHDVPTPLVTRELTLPNVTLRIDDGPYWPIPTGIVETTVVDTGPGHDTFTAMNFGFGIGIVKNLELGMRLVHYDFEAGEMADPNVYGLWRFLHGDVAELGLFVEIKLPFKSDIGMLAGMPVAIHLGDVARIDTGPFITIPLSNRSCRGDFTLGCGNDKPDFVAPFELPINVADQVYLGPEFGMYAPDFDKAYFFAGFFAGYTLRAGGGTLGDIGGRFRMPDLDRGMDVFQLIFELQFFFDL